MRSRTPLQKWFYAMYLFTTTRNGVAAKELQRQLGVTYKTAWRIGHELRKYMAWVDGDRPLGGGGSMVEIDKAFIGGYDKRGEDDKTVVLGMAEHHGGEVVTRVIHDRSRFSVVPPVLQWVQRGLRIATDEAHVFKMLDDDYEHHSVNHHAKEWARGDVHTNTIEAFWGTVKRTIRGTHIRVSRKHLQKYLWEIEFCYNLRRQPHLMFEVLLQAFRRA